MQPNLVGRYWRGRNSRERGGREGKGLFGRKQLDTELLLSKTLKPPFFPLPPLGTSPLGALGLRDHKNVCLLGFHRDLGISLFQGNNLEGRLGRCWLGLWKLHWRRAQLHWRRVGLAIRECKNRVLPLKSLSNLLWNKLSQDIIRSLKQRKTTGKRLQVKRDWS